MGDTRIATSGLVASWDALVGRPFVLFLQSRAPSGLPFVSQMKKGHVAYRIILFGIGVAVLIIGIRHASQAEDLSGSSFLTHPVPKEEFYREMRQLSAVVQSLTAQKNNENKELGLEMKQLSAAVQSLIIAQKNNEKKEFGLDTRSKVTPTKPKVRPPTLSFQPHTST